MASCSPPWAGNVYFAAALAAAMARQLYDLQQGNRDGAWSDLMDEAVKNLTVEDIVDIVAYISSLQP